MAAKLWNWRLWAGFGLSIGALVAYGFFVNETRAVFWPALLLFVVAAVLLVSGLKRRSREPELYRGKIAGPVLIALSVLIFGLFGFVVYQVLRVFPDARSYQIGSEDCARHSTHCARHASGPIQPERGPEHRCQGRRRQSWPRAGRRTGIRE